MSFALSTGEIDGDYAKICGLGIPCGGVVASGQDLAVFRFSQHRELPDSTKTHIPTALFPATGFMVELIHHAATCSRRCTDNFASLFLVVAIFLSIVCSTPVWAIEGTTVASSAGLWAPLLPQITAGAVSDSGDSLGTIVKLSGHHRFDDFRTSVESGVEYGVTDSTELFAYEFLLRDTWSFEIGELSAGTGFSQMHWTQDAGVHQLESDYTGAKIIGGWETTFGRQPIWIDLTLGLYDFDGTYTNGIVDEKIDTFTTTWSLDFKFDCASFKIPMRFVTGIDYLSDITAWRANQITTDDAVALTASVEFRLY